MAAFMAKALSALLNEDRELAECARAIAAVVALRRHRREEAQNLTTGERVFRYAIDFETAAQLEAFDSAIRTAIDQVAREGA